MKRCNCIVWAKSTKDTAFSVCQVDYLDGDKVIRSIPGKNFHCPTFDILMSGIQSIAIEDGYRIKRFAILEPADNKQYKCFQAWEQDTKGNIIKVFKSLGDQYE